MGPPELAEWILLGGRPSGSVTDEAWRGSNSRNGEENFAMFGVFLDTGFRSTLRRNASENASGRKYWHHMRGGVANDRAWQTLAVSVPEDPKVDHDLTGG